MLVEPAADAVRLTQNRPFAPEPARPRRAARPFAAVAVLVATAALLALRIFCIMYTGFAGYDDEGGILLTLHELLRGHVLYDQVTAMLGPAGLLGKYLLLRLLHLPASHDVIRAMTCIAWLGICALCGAAAARMRRSLAAGVVVASAMVVLLRAMSMEPGHPQDWCGLCVAGAFVLATFTAQPARLGVLIAIGAVGGLLAMMKINLGIFYAAALGATLLVHCRITPPVRRWLWALYAVGLLALPLTLVRGLFFQPDVHPFTVGVELALLSCVVVATAGRPPAILSPGQAMQCLAAFLLAVGVVCAIAIGLGSSCRGLLSGIVLLPWHVSKVFFIFPWDDGREPLLARVSLFLALIFALALWRNRFGTKMQLLLAGLRVLIGGICIYELLCSRRGCLAADVPVFTWLFLLPGAAEHRWRGESFCRVFIALLTVCQLLWAYPVAGSQVSFSLMGVVLICLINLGDGAAVLARPWLRFDRTAGRVLARRCGVPAAAAVIAAALCFDATAALSDYTHYRGFVSLALPGATLVHVSTSQRDDLQTEVANLRANSDRFLTVPALGSLYLWTQMEPPTLCNITSYMDLSPTEVAADLQSLRAAKHPCVLYAQGPAHMWTFLSPGPVHLGLIRGVLQAYKPALGENGWTLMIPKTVRQVTVVAPNGTRHLFSVSGDQPRPVSVNELRPADIGFDLQDDGFAAAVAPASRPPGPR